MKLGDIVRLLGTQAAVGIAMQVIAAEREKQALDVDEVLDLPVVKSREGKKRFAYRMSVERYE